MTSDHMLSYSWACPFIAACGAGDKTVGGVFEPQVVGSQVMVLMSKDIAFPPEFSRLLNTHEETLALISLPPEDPVERKLFSSHPTPP